MNAKITITVPMERIPKEVDRMLMQFTNELDQLMRDVRNTVTNQADIPQKLAMITKARETLTAVDATCDDCYSILVGYLKHQADKATNGPKTQDTEPKEQKSYDKQSDG